jgi:hypothetical protein
MKEYFMNHYAVKAMGLGFFALLFFVSSPINAQTHPCGGARAGNEVQVGEAPGSNGVAPTPLCDWVTGNQSQGSQPPPPKWSTRWGAIATDGPKGSLGTANGQSSKESAELIAMADCRAKGGTQCKVDVAYYNQCAAVVVGNGGYNTPSAATADKAVEIGMKTCSDSTTNCHAYYTACSLPIRIQ